MSSCEPASEDMSMDPSISTPTSYLIFRASIHTKRAHLHTSLPVYEEVKPLLKSHSYILSTVALFSDLL